MDFGLGGRAHLALAAALACLLSGCAVVGGVDGTDLEAGAGQPSLAPPLSPEPGLDPLPAEGPPGTNDWSIPGSGSAQGRAVGEGSPPAAGRGDLRLDTLSGLSEMFRNQAADDQRTDGASGDTLPGDQHAPLKPEDIEQVPPPEGFEPITLHADGVDVRKVLEMLSREGGMNILVSSGVKGSVTLNLENVSFDEAFRAILKLCDLVACQESELVFVYTPQELPRLDRSLQVIPLDFVTATDLLSTVNGLLSPAGSAFVTESSSTDNRKTQSAIVVEDSPEYLARIGQYITQVDHPPRQVLIEAHVLEVVLKDDWSHGVNFDHTMHILNNIGEVEVKGFANPTSASAFFVKLDSTNTEALIEALKATTDAKTLAAPRVLVLNGQESRIQIGERLGYRVTTTTETAAMENIEFLELGVVLNVTPRISWDNRVVMHVKPQVSSGRINAGLPEEETTEVETDVSLRDGQAMVVGGLIKEKDSLVQHKVPLLGDLSLVGMLFEYRKLEKQKTEIIIVLVPRVVPYCLPDEIRDQSDVHSATTPLMHGSLLRYPRPWDPRLGNSLRSAQPGRAPYIYCPADPVEDDWMLDAGIGAAAVSDSLYSGAGLP